MWLPGEESRIPTAAERERLEAGEWATCSDDPPCWHHFGYDFGNEPFTTDQALAVVGCKHESEHQGNFGYVFCADCTMELRCERVTE